MDQDIIILLTGCIIGIISSLVVLSSLLIYCKYLDEKEKEKNNLIQDIKNQILKELKK